jgi:RNA polymerase sigma-70 factor (ECF subfamily)
MVEMEMEVVHNVKSKVQSYEQLFHAYYNPLVQYAITLLKDADDAEDIVQQVFVSFWEKYDSFEIHTSERAMLYKAVHNASLNKIKFRKVRTTFAQELTTEIENHTAVEELEAKELQHKINQTIDNLPEQCGKIFKMSRFEQLKYQEIADQLGLSVKTIENQMGKALKLVRESLKAFLTIVILFLIEK